MNPDTVITYCIAICAFAIGTTLALWMVSEK